MPPIVTLTTDFGASDHYVGVMKGVILGICPAARIVDISHQVTPYAIGEGAYLIGQAYRYFPKKTVHVVVVDPGVGTNRRALVAQAGGQLFVAPDNGVLDLVCAREKHTVRAITNARYFLKPVSQTFHGRDVFSPVGAHLAAGVSAAQLGKRIEDYVRGGFDKPQLAGVGRFTGRALHVDGFGNVVTCFPTADFLALANRKFALTVGSRQVTVLARNYAERPAGELFLIAGSGGYLEISVGQGSAAALTNCAAGAALELKIW